MESSQWEKWPIVFFRVDAFSTDHLWEFLVWNRDICTCGIIYFKFHGVDTINIVTELWIIQWRNTIYIVERKINTTGLDYFCFSCCFLFLFLFVLPCIFLGLCSKIHLYHYYRLPCTSQGLVNLLITIWKLFSIPFFLEKILLCL